jgi:hypothetical protein
VKLIELIYRYKGNRYLVIQKPYAHDDSLEDLRYFHLHGNFSCDCNRCLNISGFTCPKSIMEMMPAGFVNPSSSLNITCYPDFPVLPCGDEVTVELLDFKEMTVEQVLSLAEFFRTHAIQPGADGYYELEVHPEVLES